MNLRYRITKCQEKEWVERAHFALAWVYIHDKDFASAKEHIATLPSVQSNRLQESILAQIADFEGGVEAMKEVVRGNLQNFTRVINKEILSERQEEILTKLRQWEGENHFGNFWNLVEK